jgi:death-on-curing protein
VRVEYLDLADLLAITELVLEIPADQISRISRLELAESALHAPAASFGGVEFYPDLATKAAVLCTRLVKNHTRRRRPTSHPHRHPPQAT